MATDTNALSPKIKQLLATRKQTLNQVELEMLQVVEQNPTLKSTNPVSRLLMVAQVMSMGLQTDKVAGEVAFINYDGNVQLQIQSKGMVRLVKARNPDVVSVGAMAVKESQEDTPLAELIAFNRNTLTPRQQMNLDAEKTVAYAAWFVKGTETFSKLMSLEEIKAHGRQYSKSFDKGPWSTAFDQMARKTVIKSLIREQSKLQNIEADREMLRYDQAAFTEDGDVAYVDNPMAITERGTAMTDEQWAEIRKWFVDAYRAARPIAEGQNVEDYNRAFANELAKVAPNIGGLRKATDETVKAVRDKWTAHLEPVKEPRETENEGSDG